MNKIETVEDNTPTMTNSAGAETSPISSYSTWTGHFVAFIKKVVLLFISLIISLYIAEIVLSSFPELSSQDKTKLIEYRTRQRGLPFDGRTKPEAVRDLRLTGDSWYPSVSPTNFVGGKTLLVNGNPVLPLGGVANANILYCNESGLYSTYTSDEYGFHNPSGIGDEQRKLMNVFVGDSFTNGSCVMPGEGFVDRTREIFPSTVNLAATGNGPLSELACIKEYLQNRELGFVFWVYFEGNDLSDLDNKEIKEPILMRYHDESEFSQGLISNRDAVNSEVISFVNAELVKELEKPKPTAEFLEHLSLGSTKMTLFKLRNSMVQVKPTEYDLTLFGSILNKAKSSIEKRGGQMVFIYLPDYARYDGNRITKGSAAHLKDDVIRLVKSLAVETIDVDAAFAKLEDPRSVFTFGSQNHYNAGGNLIIAGEILRFLNTVRRKT